MWQILFEESYLHPHPPKLVGRRQAKAQRSLSLVLKPAWSHRLATPRLPVATRGLRSLFHHALSPILLSPASFIPALGPAKIFWTISASIPNYWPHFLGWWKLQLKTLEFTRDCFSALQGILQNNCSMQRSSLFTLKPREVILSS